MNADKIAKNLEDIIRFGPMMMSQEYADSVREAALAFDAVRKMLKIQWEVDNGERFGLPIRMDINKILNEFHLTEDEIKELDEKYPNHLNGRPKCRDCVWLSDEKTVIGRKCICPDKKFNTKTAMWKHQSNPVCKKFKRREE